MNVRQDGEVDSGRAQLSSGLFVLLEGKPADTLKVKMSQSPGFL